MATMAIVLVHGNPETEAIWGPLVDALERDDVVPLSPPGFGAPLPADFPATYLAYRDWLEDELERLDQPVDVVGHDWGGGHVMNMVMHRPELVRSWASDVVGLFDPEYIWHDLAQVWQTPGDTHGCAVSLDGATAARATTGRGQRSRSQDRRRTGRPTRRLSGSAARVGQRRTAIAVQVLRC
jgi:pimeloyl-ACP methyl ester carboxylesterase